MVHGLCRARVGIRIANESETRPSTTNMAATSHLPVLLAIATILIPALTSGSNVVEVAEDYGAGMFAKLVKECAFLKHLLTTSTQPMGYTVFAFSDRAFKESPAAFKKLVNNTQALQWALEYHTILGPTLSEDIKDNLLITSLYPYPPVGNTLSPQFVRTNIYEILSEPQDGNKLGATQRKVVTASGAPIVVPDRQASNGIVHIIDKVMFPLPTGADMAVYLQDQPQFSTLYSLLMKANLTKALKTDPSRPLTIFAPSNTAISKLPKDVLNKLKNVTFLQHVLEYHVVAAALYSAGLYDNETLHPLFNKTLLVQRGVGGIYLQDSKVVQADATVTNGVVHEINGVLIPPK